MAVDIEALLSEMTLAEKIGQLNMLAAGFSVTGPVLAEDATAGIRAGTVGSLLNVFGSEATGRLQRLAVEESRLKIPLIFGFDVVHGHRTIFPIPLGETASFDPDLWERTARAAAIEAAEDGVSLTFAPMIDVSRDPRWGRIAESPGEDPLVASVFAAAKVRGFQGADLGHRRSIAATAKHFAAYGAVTAGRDYASVDVSERILHEVYLPPFAAAAAAGAAAVMPSFTDLAGMPMTADADLLRGWLRGAKGFAGVVVSDYHAIAELIVHGVAADLAEAASLALKAGVDIDMMSGAYVEGLPQALDRGLVGMADVDAAVRRVLTLKQRLGLFERPQGRGDPMRGASDLRPDVRELAREAAQRSLVLLVNRDAILPISPSRRRIAVVGPLADARAEMLGSWSAAGQSADCVTLLEGLRAGLPEADIVHAPGVGIDGTDVEGMAASVDLCRSADLVIMALGEAHDMSGEASSRATLDLPGRQTEFAGAILDAGRPTVAAVFAGRPLSIGWLTERAGATLLAWFPGSEAGHAIADVLTGKVSPSARLPVTMPRHVGQVPIFFAARPSGRPTGIEHYTSKYIDMPVTPLFPFGHGLTYGEPVFSRPQASPPLARPGETITLSVDVENAGAVSADEAVFVFVRGPSAGLARPRLSLAAFSRIVLQPGETGRVTILLPVAHLAVLDRSLEPVLPDGVYEFLIGPCADLEVLQTVTVRVAAAPAL